MKGGDTSIRKQKSNSLYVAMKEYMWNGEKYLIDEENWAYTFDLDSPERIGKKLIDGTIKRIQKLN